MPCMRCTDCGISFPTGTTKCLGCGGKVDRIDNASPTPDFRGAAAAVKEAMEEAERVADLIPSIHAKVKYRDGQYFISSIDVCKGGYQTELPPDTLIRVGNQFFEIGGYSYSRREYWVLLVGNDVELEEEKKTNDTGDDVSVRPSVM